jgi:hypothetical protein
MKYPEIVAKTKLLYTGGGVPLIKPGVFTDEFIDEQITLVMDEKLLSEREIDAIVRYCVDNNLNKEDSEKQLMKFLNWNCKPDEKFWRESGSIIIKKEYFKTCSGESGKIPWNALGWDDVFGPERHETFYKQRSLIYGLDNAIKTLRELRKQKTTLKSQNSYMFKSADEYIKAIENAKKTIEADAIKFYRDPNHSFQDRLSLFNMLGKSETYIFHPKHKGLDKIFEIHQEQGYVERHQKYYCWDVIEWWMNQMLEGRCKIDYSRNQYHPDLKQKKRNYVSSQAAIDRLYNYYLNLLIVEGVSEFIFDW